MNKEERIKGIEKIISNIEIKYHDDEERIVVDLISYMKDIAIALEEAMGIDYVLMQQIFKITFKEAINTYKLGDMINDEFSSLAKAISTNKEVIKIKEIR